MPWVRSRYVHPAALQVLRACVEGVPGAGAIEPTVRRIGWVGQMNFLSRPQSNASPHGRVGDAAEDELLVWVVAARLRTVAEIGRTVRVVAQRVVLSREPVISPQSVIPVLDNMRVAADDDGPEFGRRVPLVGENARPPGDIERVVAPDHRLIQRRYTGDVLHSGCDLHDSIATVVRRKHRPHLAVLDRRIIAGLRPTALEPGDRFQENGRHVGRRLNAFDAGQSE